MRPVKGPSSVRPGQVTVRESRRKEGLATRGVQKCHRLRPRWRSCQGFGVLQGLQLRPELPALGLTKAPSGSCGHVVTALAHRCYRVLPLPHWIPQEGPQIKHTSCGSLNCRGLGSNRSHAKVTPSRPLDKGRQRFRGDTLQVIVVRRSQLRGHNGLPGRGAGHNWKVTGGGRIQISLSGAGDGTWWGWRRSQLIGHSWLAWGWRKSQFFSGEGADQNWLPWGLHRSQLVLLGMNGGA